MVFEQRAGRLYVGYDSQAPQTAVQFLLRPKEAVVLSICSLKDTQNVVQVPFSPNSLLNRFVSTLYLATTRT